MFKVNQITRDSLQKQNLILADGTTLVITLYFMPQQLGWFIRELTYGTVKIQGMRICNNLNILNQFKNKLPFGLACIRKNDREPTQIDDFLSGNSILYILSSDEVEEYTRFLSGQ